MGLGGWIKDQVTGGPIRRAVTAVAGGNYSGAAQQAFNPVGSPIGTAIIGVPEGQPLAPSSGLLPAAEGNPFEGGSLGSGGGKGNADVSGEQGVMADAIRRAALLNDQANFVQQNALSYQGREIPGAAMIQANAIAARPISDQAQLEVALRGQAERYQADQIATARDVNAERIDAANLAPFARMDAAQVGPAERITAPTLANAVGMAGPTLLNAATAQATDPNAQRIDTAGQMGTQAAQLRALGMVEGEAAGTGIGGQLANARLQTALGDITQNNLGIAGMSRGAERAGARREAMLQNSRQGMAAANSANEAALASRLGAMGQLTGAAEGARGQDIGLSTSQAQLNAQAENLRAQLQTATAQGNAQEVNRLQAQFQTLQQAAREQMANATNDNSRLQAQMQLTALQGNQTAGNERTALAAQLQQQANLTNATGQNAYGALGAQLQQQANMANQSTSLAAMQGNQATEAARFTAQAGLNTGANAGNAAAGNLASAQDQAAINANRQAQAERMQQAEIARSQQQLAAEQANQQIGYQTQLANQQADMTVNQNRAANAQTDQQIRQSGALGAITAGTGAVQAQSGTASDSMRAKLGLDQNAAQNRNAAVQGVATVGAAILSDERTKDNIDEPSPGELGELANAIRVKSYSYKGDGQKRYGVMAQDIERTALGRDLVSAGPGGVKTVDYGGLVALLAADAARSRKARPEERR